MDWLESKLENVLGADNEPLRGGSPDQIAHLAEHVLDGDTMVDFVRDFFVSQKGFSDFIGVGESTVAGWMKSRSFPAYAKRAALAAYFARKHWGAFSAARRDARRPKVVKDGDVYLVVRFAPPTLGDCGAIIARDIPTEKAASLFASSVRAWELLDELCDVVDWGIHNSNDFAPGWLEPLAEELRRERERGSFDAIQMFESEVEKVSAQEGANSGRKDVEDS